MRITGTHAAVYLRIMCVDVMMWNKTEKKMVRIDRQQFLFIYVFNVNLWMHVLDRVRI